MDNNIPKEWEGKELKSSVRCIICEEEKKFHIPIPYDNVYVCTGCKKAIRRLKDEQKAKDFVPYV